MATTTYTYTNRDNLIKIADMYKTNVSTLVDLNSWLKDPIDGHTNLKPSEISITQIETNLVNTGRIVISTPIVKGSLHLYVYYSDSVEEYTDSSKDGKLNKTSDSDKITAGSIRLKHIDYNNNYITYSNGLNVKELKLVYVPSAKKDYLVVPLIGNGNSAAEDYWITVDGAIGIHHDILLSNIISRGSNNISSDEADKISSDYYTEYNLVNLDKYTADLVDSELSNNLTIDTYRPPESNLIDDSLEKYSADFIAYNAKTATQVAINNSAINTYKYKSNTDCSTLNKIETIGDYSVRTYRVFPLSFNSNSAYGKCTVTIGNTTLEMPCYPEQVQDGTSANYSEETPLGRSEPFMVYTHTSKRSIPFTFVMHREMTGNEAEIERIVRYIESGVYPNYSGSVAAVKTTVKIGNQISITGVMTSEQTVWSGPIDKNGKYNQVTVNFTIDEVTDNPKSHSYVYTNGGWRV